MIVIYFNSVSLVSSTVYFFSFIQQYCYGQNKSYGPNLFVGRRNDLRRHA